MAFVRTSRTARFFKALEYAVESVTQSPPYLPRPHPQKKIIFFLFEKKHDMNHVLLTL